MLDAQVFLLPQAVSYKKRSKNQKKKHLAHARGSGFSSSSSSKEHVINA
jgi:hypothetical protein